MKPDKHFVETLKSVDRGLDVVWSPAMEVWVIYYTNPQGRTFKVYEVREEDGSFRPLDTRTITLMNQWNTKTDSRNADQIAKDRYEAHRAAQLKKKQNDRLETKYKAKQLTSWWARKIDFMLDNKLYSKTPIKPMIMKAISMGLMSRNSGKLIGKLGLPHLHGRVYDVKP